MKKLFMCFILLLSLVMITSCKKVKFDESKGIIVIGLECDYAPFNWLETTQTATNYPVDNILY